MELPKKTCPDCGYKWILRTPEPIRCPNCQHSFLADRRRAIMQKIQAQDDDPNDLPTATVGGDNQ